MAVSYCGLNYCSVVSPSKYVFVFDVKLRKAFFLTLIIYLCHVVGQVL